MCRKKNIIIILTIFAFAIVLFCLPGQVLAKSIRLVAAHVSPIDSPYTPGFNTFKDIIEKETNGEIKVSVHPAGELGGNEDILVQKMQTGTVDVIITSASFLAQTAKEADLFSLLYLFKDTGHWARVLDGSPGKQMTAGVRHYFGNKPVTTPNDLKGVKIRVHTSPVIRDTWIALGAQPTNVAFSELYQALQNKVVDAGENSFTYIYKMKFYEVSPYVSLTSHDFAVRFLLMSDKKFTKLTPLQQLTVEKAAREATLVEREADYISMVEDIETLKKLGSKINRVDADSFLKLTAPLREKAAEKLGLQDMVKQIDRLQ